MYASRMQSMDEGEGSRSGLVLEMLLAYWSSWLSCWSGLNDGLKAYVFTLSILLMKGAKLVLASLYPGSWLLCIWGAYAHRWVCIGQGALGGAIRCGDPYGLELLTNVYLGVLRGCHTQIGGVPTIEVGEMTKFHQSIHTTGMTMLKC